MAVTIRLQRQGAKKHPFYRVVVADSRRARNGKFLEWVGTYNPGKDPAALDLELARIDEWVKNGAQPSDTVRHLVNQFRRRAAAAPAAGTAAPAPAPAAKAPKAAKKG